MMTGRKIPRGVLFACAAGLGCVCVGCDLLLIVGQPRVCGGLAGLSCREGEYCNFEDGSCGAADQPGKCAEIPNACTLEIALVCGCDDKTYSNACAAATAGVSVVREGPCSEACGGLQGLACAEDEYCNFTDGSCGAADQTGECTPIPDVCPEIFAPVCGCSGRTYGNACEAGSDGVSVASEGPCGEPCGGLEGLACAEGEYCNHADGSCGAADQIGECATIPEVCTDEVDPVCGCDGMTYSNECTANAAGLSIRSVGECPEEAPGPGPGPG